MSSQNRAALIFVLGAGALPAVAQPTKASQPASAGSVPEEQVNPHGGVEWFMAGLVTGIILTVAWMKIRGKDKGDKGGGTAAVA